ncbi:LANO_0F12376g1_1 [Lachancea nothofagi CBS 11611]|uniref:LANO_0F12376g1_1 n=1 Tax=Lachancea nothofagi CBS 11611 TaxID=1266666 RepID=A0A1G4KBA7_9SACH|nr:LANO_0F12376g1_1 [Lachancea nothofagi CBS 11611]
MPKQISKTEPIIIVGAGVSGLSTAYALLKRGFENVHIFDKRDYITQGYNYFKGCDSPSSDMNKIFRAAYGEQTHYQKMSLDSRKVFLNWNQMIKDCNFEGGDPVYLNSGNIHLTSHHELPLFETLTLQNMAPSQAIRVSDSDAIEKAGRIGLPLSAVDPFEMKRRGKHLEGVLDTTGGMIISDKCCRWVLHLCRSEFPDNLTTHLGADIGEIDHLLLEYVKDTGKKKCVGIKTKDKALHFARLVVTACGPWTGEVVPEAQEKLEATGGTVVLIKVTNPKTLEKYSEKNFPTWTYDVRDKGIGGLYGFPIRNGYMKIGYRGLKWTNPTKTLNSQVKTAYSDCPETNVPIFGLKLIKQFIAEHIPEVRKIDKTRLCWYSDSEDNDFLISYSPQYADNSLFTIGGDSGHAFMMFGSIGEVIADIIMESDADPFLKDLFSWTRKREPINAINKGIEDPRALCNQLMATENDWVVRESSKL